MSDNWKDTNPKDVTAASEGRVPIGLFPETAVIAGTMAMWEGACKYGRYNYRVAGVSASVYYGALGRHMKAWYNGEDIDPKSGLPHLWKALACLGILIDADECGMLHDDRPPEAPVADMLERLAPLVREIAAKLADFDPHQYTIHDSPGRQSNEDAGPEGNTD